MHVILTGATGLVGSAALRAMLINDSISRISILSRRPVAQASGHSKAHVILVSDFSSYPPSLSSELRGAHAIVWAQGISQNKVSRTEYERITKTYPLAFAKFALDPASGLATADDPLVFVHVSGGGATRKPGMLTPLFGRVKGEAEAELERLSKDSAGAFKVFNARVGGVDPAGHEEIAPYLPKDSLVKKAAGAVVMPLFNTLVPRYMAPTKELGQALVNLALGDGGPLSGADVADWEGRTIENPRLMQIGGRL